MVQVPVGREDSDRVAAGVRDENVSSVVHFQSGRSKEVLSEEGHEAILDLDPEDGVMVEVGHIEPLPCKDKKSGISTWSHRALLRGREEQRAWEEGTEELNNTYRWD
jgi:hypothetical protein